MSLKCHFKCHQFSDFSSINFSLFICHIIFTPCVDLQYLTVVWSNYISGHLVSMVFRNLFNQHRGCVSMVWWVRPDWSSNRELIRLYRGKILQSYKRGDPAGEKRERNACTKNFHHTYNISLICFFISECLTLCSTEPHIASFLHTVSHYASYRSSLTTLQSQNSTTHSPLFSMCACSFNFWPSDGAQKSTALLFCSELHTI